MSFSQIYSDIWTRKISARSLSSIYRTLGLVYSLHPLIWYVKFDFTSMLCWPTRVWFGIIIIGNLCVAPWVDIYIPFVFPPVRQTRPVRWLCLTRAALEFNKKNSIELINCWSLYQPAREVSKLNTIQSQQRDVGSFSYTANYIKGAKSIDKWVNLYFFYPFHNREV